MFEQKYTKDQKKIATQLFLNGMTAKEVEKKTGVKKGTVYNLGARAKSKNKRKKRVTVTPELHQQILELHKKGKTLTQIAKKTKVSVITARRYTIGPNKRMTTKDTGSNWISELSEQAKDLHTILSAQNLTKSSKKKFASIQIEQMIETLG